MESTVPKGCGDGIVGQHKQVARCLRAVVGEFLEEARLPDKLHSGQERIQGVFQSVHEESGFTSISEHGFDDQAP